MAIFCSLLRSHQILVGKKERTGHNFVQNTLRLYKLHPNKNKQAEGGKSAVEEIGRHEQLEGDLRRNLELGYLGGGVGVLRLVLEVHADLLQNM